MGKETLWSLQQNWLCKLQWIIDSLSGKERNDLLVLLWEDKLERKEVAICKIISDLRQNHMVEYPEEVECKWKKYKWRRVCLDLWWVKFECFISDDEINRDKYENSDLKGEWFFGGDILDLFNLVWEYMKMCLINIDDSVSIKDYKYISLGRTNLPDTLSWWDVGRCIVEVLGLKGKYIINTGFYYWEYPYIQCYSWYLNCSDVKNVSYYFSNEKWEKGRLLLK